MMQQRSSLQGPGPSRRVHGQHGIAHPESSWTLIPEAPMTQSLVPSPSLTSGGLAATTRTP